MASVSESLTATGSVDFDGGKPPTDTLVLAVISGTYGTVTFVFEGTMNGTNWFPVAAVRADTQAVVNGTISPTDNSTAAWRIDGTELSNVRARVTAIASGTVTFTLESGSFVGIPFISTQTTTGSTVASTEFTGNVTISGGSDLIFSGATGENQLLMTDNLASALKVGVSGSTYLTFVTTDSADKIRLADNIKLSFGDGDDITVAWDNTDLDILQATANSSIKWGIDGAGIDQVYYGDTASAAATWDQSDDSLIFSGVAKAKFQTIAAATGTAIPVTHSGSFPITQNGAETNTLAIPTYLGQWLNIFVDTDTSGARVITSAQRINQAGNTIITLTEVGDFIKLEAITIAGALRWQVVSNDGAALS